MPFAIRIILAVLLCIGTVSGTQIPDAEIPELAQCHIDRLGMTIALPQDAYVTDRTVERDFAPLEMFGLTADELELQYKKGNIYCNALWFPEDTDMTEILVTMTEDDDSRAIFRLSDYDMTYLQALADSYASFAQQGQSVSAMYSNASVVLTEQAAFIRAHGAMASRDVAENHLHYMTVVNGRRIEITLIEHYYDKADPSELMRVSAQNERLMERIISELRFDTVENEFIAKNRGFLTASGVIIAVCVLLLAAYYISNYRARRNSDANSSGQNKLETELPEEAEHENGSDGIANADSSSDEE